MNAWDLGADTAKLQQDLDELRDVIAQIEGELTRRERLDAPQRLAEELHSVQCHINHTDGCGWFYEFSNGEANWSGWAHARYLEKARKLLSEVSDDPEEVIRIVKAIR